jgi:hypothetical protein
MRTFASQPNRVRPPVSSASTRSRTEIPAPLPPRDLVLQLQRTIGNHAVERMSQIHKEAHNGQPDLAIISRQRADAEDSPKAAPKPPAKPPKCDTGCAQRWGQDTTCSKWGFFQGVAEGGEGKKWRSWNCCNSWPLSVEDYARSQLGLSGAASCTVRHEKEVATVSFGDKEVDVLCSDTIPTSMFGEQAKASACTGDIDTEVIELSPKAMQELSGQLANALHVKVCYSGTKQDLCLHNGPGAKSFPTIQQCLTKGCSPWADTPTTHDKSGWPRV